MPKPAINLRALERVVGKAPPRYPEGDLRNRARLRWWGNAVKALGRLMGRAPHVRPRKLQTPEPRTYRGWMESL